MKLLFASLLQLLFLPAYGQQYFSKDTQDKATIAFQYHLTYRPDSSSSSTREDNFILFIGNKFSLFRDKTALTHDSLLASHSSEPFDQQHIHSLGKILTKMSFPTFNYSIYKIFSGKKDIYFDLIGSKLYAYEEAGTTLTWRISSEKSIIAGYHCQKALTTLGGRAFEAWFTREIPISDGPYKFQGLPGLIIKVNDIRNYYVFELLKSSQLPNPVEINFPKGKFTIISKQSFQQSQVAYAAGAAERVAAMGNTITDAQKQSYHERLKKQNNSLELK